ncbi:ubiquitin-conjugating enzyme E2 J1-like [Corticium candelabrum]|uniref:ubiquitin-conjugating enzyme E2 J1-like n=1 Tax=Corticium candelabrum TaxID=121492 RepID=UPI002E2608E1|nr:ubiquitin-conjugating enzyme E2 J1-like [Corticium candelabrum]
MEGQYNLRSPAVKRLMREAKEMKDPTYHYYAQPLEDNLFEWHFTVRGPPDGPYDGGIYHGRIMFPAEYPMKPPSVMLLTPNGRFETGKKICLSISAYHPEMWQPSWSIRTVLVAISGFMPTKGGGAIGALDYTTEERQKLAKKSVDWRCSICNFSNRETLLSHDDDNVLSEQVKQDEEMAAQISFKSEAEVKAAAAARKETQPNTTDENTPLLNADEDEQTQTQTEPVTTDVSPPPVLRQRAVPDTQTPSVSHLDVRQQSGMRGGRGLFLFGLLLLVLFVSLVLRRFNKVADQPHLAF